MPANIDLTQVKWDTTPQIDPTQVKWDTPTATAQPPAPQQSQPESMLHAAVMEAPRLLGEVAGGLANTAVKAGKGIYGGLTGAASLARGEGLDTALQKANVAIGDRNAVLNKEQQIFGPSATSQFLGKHIIQPAVQGISDFTGQPELIQGVAEAVGDIASLYGLGKSLPPIAKALSTSTGGVAREVGNAAAGVLGTTTGTGKRFIKQAFNPGDETKFTAALRGGELGGHQIVADVKDALNSWVDQEGDKYRDRLASISQNSAPITDAPKILDAALSKKLKDGFRVKITPAGVDKAGKVTPKVLDLGGSTLPPSEYGVVQKIVDMVDGWRDLTPLGLDTLKKKIGAHYRDTQNISPFIADARNAVNDILKDRVSGYKEMTADYAKAARFNDEASRTLSLGTKPAIDTTLRKLMSTQKDNFPFRSEIISQLEAATGKELQSGIAGYGLSSLTPTGGLGKLTAGGGGLIAGVSHALTPSAIAMFGLASPRIVGEVVRMLGLSRRAVRDVVGNLPKVRQYAAKLHAVPNLTARDLPALAAGATPATTAPMQQGGEIPGAVQPGAGDNTLTPMQTGEYVIPVDAIIAAGRELSPHQQLDDQAAHALGKQWLDQETERLKQLAGNPVPPNNAGPGRAEGGVIGNPLSMNQFTMVGQANKPGADYDMKGYQEKYGVSVVRTPGQHYTDEFKYPNHMTFSDQSKYSTPQQQGGRWTPKQIPIPGPVQGTTQQWHFYASPFNVQQNGAERMQQYFKTQEPGNVLHLPNAQGGYAEGGAVAPQKQVIAPVTPQPVASHTIPGVPSPTVAPMVASHGGMALPGTQATFNKPFSPYHRRHGYAQGGMVKKGISDL